MKYEKKGWGREIEIEVEIEIEIEEASINAIRLLTLTLSLTLSLTLALTLTLTLTPMIFLNNCLKILRESLFFTIADRRGTAGLKAAFPKLGHEVANCEPGTNIFF